MPWIDTTNLTQAVSEIKAYCTQAFAAISHSHSNATTSAAGFMSSTDKTRLDGLQNTYVYSGECDVSEIIRKQDGTFVPSISVTFRAYIHTGASDREAYSVFWTVTQSPDGTTWQGTSSFSSSTTYTFNMSSISATTRFIKVAGKDMMNGEPLFEIAIPVTSESAGIPSGGTAGQLLAKDSSTDYDADWKTLTPSDIGALDEDDYLAGMTWDYLEAHFTWDDLDGTNTSGSDTYTTNLNLTKPGRLSTVAINNDLDILDAKIGAVGNTSLQSQVTALGESVSLHRMNINGVAFAANEQKSIGSIPEGAILVGCVMNGPGYAYLTVTNGLSGAIWVTNRYSYSITVDFRLYYVAAQ